MSNKITKTEVVKSVGKRGWHFNIYWGNRKYPNRISLTYKTKKLTETKLKDYLNNGTFEYYN